MGFFKKKPDTKIMGFLVSQTSFNRINEIDENASDEKKYMIYALSTCIIARVLEQQYASHIIEKTLQNSDDFFIKQYKQFKGSDALQRIAEKRSSWLSLLNLEDGMTIQQIAHEFGDDEEKMAEYIRQWAEIPLMISSNIKSQ